ncbi:DinB superfamily protein [compost metagenome]
MQKPLKEEYNPYYQHYIDLVPDGKFDIVFNNNTQQTISFFENIPVEKHEYKYQPGKWSIKEVLMHIIDTERVMSYRTLVAARGDNNTPLPSFDEDGYANNVDVSNRNMADLLDEFKAVRSGTEKLVNNLTEAQLKFKANAVTHPITACALSYIMIGHINHHINVLKERYL